MSNTRRSQAFETRPPRKEDRGGAKLIRDQQTKAKNHEGKDRARKESGKHQIEEVATAVTNHRRRIPMIYAGGTGSE